MITSCTIDAKIERLRMRHTHYLDLAIQADNDIYDATHDLERYEQELEKLDYLLEICQSVKAAMS